MYVKKVGRSPKARKKQPYEVQGRNGPRLSKHGMVMTCRYCGVTGYNRAGCSLTKSRLRPKLPTHRNPTNEVEEMYDEGPPLVR